MKREQLIEALTKLGPQAYCDVLFRSFGRKKNDDQIEIMSILFAKQLESAKRDNSEKQILVSPLMESNPFLKQPIEDDEDDEDDEKNQCEDCFYWPKQPIAPLANPYGARHCECYGEGAPTRWPDEKACDKFKNPPPVGEKED